MPCQDDLPRYMREFPFYECLWFLSRFSVNVTYIDREGVAKPVRGKVGDNLMYLAHRHNIELEGLFSSLHHI